MNGRLQRAGGQRGPWVPPEPKPRPAVPQPQIPGPANVPMHVHSSGSCEGAAAARPVPREMVVFAELRRRVLAGVYAKGERLPPLAAVGEEFGVSEQVAQRAVARLRELGLLCTVPTRGTWVVETITDRARMRTAFDAARSGVFLDDMFAPDAGPLVEFPSTWIARLLDESDERLT